MMKSSKRQYPITLEKEGERLLIRKKFFFLTEDLSDDEVIEEDKKAAFNINPIWVESDTADIKEDDMSDDLSASENCDIEDDILD